ncbi:MAG: hypothetical protein HN704_14255 [Bacteroidetes bacterium]|jgi:hypothetical protein|nr:hypothetical protein [Bacteroidota bacterium]MBT6685347.1 hypothetical protein [Bacteroidota bacterium]MBT7145073.1 hypothetical protein [Bacteroidota bacterium]MBT7492758.1 hypothetical protein [Bacteroidota bacterium]
MDFIWYSAIINSDNIEQGDLIKDCPIVIPPSKIEEGDEPEIEIRLINSIILSQSCDLVNNKIDIVLVCPYYPLKVFIENLPEDQNSKKLIKKNIDNLRKGYLPGYHLLNKFDDLKINDYLVVDFRNVYGIEINNLKDIAYKQINRIRLLPPYREHLSQAFARYFMRVGLPQDILIEGY